MAFHISDKDGQPRPCRAASPDSCPVGGEHFSDKVEAQSAADTKLAGEYSTTSTVSKKVDLSKREPMKQLDNGRYSIKAGEYYVVSTEDMRLPEGMDYEIMEAIERPAGEDDDRSDAIVGGNIGGEPVYTVVEGWSGVSNTLMSPKLYDALVKKGIDFGNGDEKPNAVVFKNDTTLGTVNGDPDEDNPDYGMMEVGDTKVDLYHTQDGGMIRAKKTVIDAKMPRKKAAKKIDLTKRESMKPLENGRYEVKAGEYYVVSTEDMRLPEGMDYDIITSIDGPAGEDDDRSDAIIGGNIGGEPVYTVTEGWSAVSNTLMSPKLYDEMVKKGVDFGNGDEKPNSVVFKNDTTLGSVNGDPNEDNPDYGMMEVGDKKIDFWHTQDGGILRTKKTVID